MKKHFNFLLFVSIFSVLIISCKKDEVKSIYEGGATPTLSSSISGLNLVPADSSADVITFNWSDPAYTISGNTTTHNVAYILEFDSAGKNFANAKTIEVANTLSAAVTGRAFNKVLSDLGMTDSSKDYSLDVRLYSSLYVTSTRLISNTIAISGSPYSTEPSALYPVPDNLYLVGDATQGGWGNPVPVPTQKFTKIDKFNFGGVFQLLGGLKYLFLPVNGDWGHKYAIEDAGAPGASSGGDFIPDQGQDIPSPATAGLYRIIVNFVTGKYTVSPVTASADIPPVSLYIVGDATAGGWGNPVPIPSQQFAQVSSGGFEIILPLSSAKKYLFLPQNGSWDHKYAIADAAAPGVKEGGTLVVDTGQDIPSPDEDGNYKISVEFISRTYKLTKQ